MCLLAVSTRRPSLTRYRREGELDEREVDVEVPPSSPRVMGPFGGSEAAGLQVRRQMGWQAGAACSSYHRARMPPL